MAAESVLAQVNLFAGLDEQSLESLEAFTFRRTLSEGEEIVEEGRTGNGLFIVLSGNVEVVKGLAGKSPQVLAPVSPSAKWHWLGNGRAQLRFGRPRRPSAWVWTAGFS